MFGIFKYKKLVAAIVIVFMVIVGVGVYFATAKGEPEYKSKIDKLMFDKKNKSPKYVITLPEKTKRVIEQIKASLPEPTQSAEPPKKEKITLQELFNNTPTLSKITPVAEKSPLKYVDNVPSLVESVDGLEVPNKSSDGKEPWTEYSKSIDVMPNFYKVSIIIKNMGMDLALTELLIKGAPANVSLAFSPYGRNLKNEIKMAREYGHETYVDLLLPSKDFLSEDTGPLAMSITASETELMERLRKTIAPGAPIGGVIVNEGSVGEDNKELLTKVMTYLRDRGLLVVDATRENGINDIIVENLPRRKADIIIDSHYNREYIAKQIELAENIAKENGHVVIVIDAKPILLLMMKTWMDGFSPQMSYEEAKVQGVDINAIEKPFALVPVSAVVIE